MDPRDQALEKTARGGEKGWDREARPRRAGYRDRPGIWTPLWGLQRRKEAHTHPRVRHVCHVGRGAKPVSKDGSSLSSHLPLVRCEDALGRWPFNLFTTLEVGSVSGILDRPTWPLCDFI